MCKLSLTEEKIVANIRGRSRKALAQMLGVQPGTLNSHIARIKKKRAAAKRLLRRTNLVKKELYPKRRGE